MIDYLEQLVEAGEFAKAIELGEQLLKARENGPRDLLAINCSLLTAQFSLGRLQRAITMGELCLDLSVTLEEWDRFGTTSLYVGVAYSHLHHHSEAARLFEGYLHQIDRYTDAGRFQFLAQYNLGLTYSALGKAQSAASILAQALEKVPSENTRTVHGIRHALIDAKLAIGETEFVPRLLAQCGSYLRNNPNEDRARQSWLQHLELRARHSLQTNRLTRARLICVRGLSETSEVEDGQYQAVFHLLLTRIFMRLERSHEALGHAVAAQACAKNGARPDVERAAMDLIYLSSKSYAAALDEIDDYYLSH